MTDDELDQALRALAHPARRAIMRVTAIEPLPAGEVAAMLGVAPATASEHLRVLRGTGLAEFTTQGARRLYRALPARVADVTAVLLDRTTIPPHDLPNDGRGHPGQGAP
jgi:DNA-binding transcriptional ArsR family regulator